MNNTLVVVATLTAKAGHEATLRQALEIMVPPSRAEAACLRYELHEDQEHAGRFVMLEEWTGAAGLALHNDTPHFATLVAAIGGLAEVHVAKLNKIA